MRTTITFLSACYFPVSSVGKNGKQRCLGEVVWVWTLTVQGLQIVKINMLLRTQKVAGSWIADNVFDSHAALWPFDTTPDCARTTHDKPGSVSRINRGQGGQAWSLLAVDTHDLYNLTCNKLVKFLRCCCHCSFTHCYTHPCDILQLAQAPP